MAADKPPKPPTPSHLELIVAQEIERWGGAQYDVLALRLAVTGLCHRHGTNNEALWTDGVVVIAKLDQLAEAFGRHEGIFRNLYAVLSAEPPEGARPESLH